MDDYRSFALQLFQVRQERDPPFVLMSFNKGEKVAVVWFRDVHLATGPFYKGLFPAGIEHLFWPNFNHHASLDPPLELCERASCTACSGLVEDEKLQITFTDKHSGPWKKEGERLLRTRQKEAWESQYAPQVAAARAEMTGKMDAAELDAKIEAMETQLRERLEEEVTSAVVEKERCVRPFKKCGRCKLVRYCSAKCQKDDWNQHQRYCRKEGD